MYTTRLNGMEDEGPVYQWGLYDPEGEYICSVTCQHSALVLLSHLNRG